MLGLEHDARAVAEESLHGRLAFTARLRLDQGNDDVVRLRRVLTVDQNEVAVADVRLDHRLAPDTKREDVLAASGQRGRGDRHLTLPVFLSEQRRARGDPAEDRHGLVRPAAANVGERQRPRGPAHARPSLQLALALEGPEMIERGAGGDLEALAELAHGRRDAVLGLEAPHETQHFPLSVRQLSHGRSPDPEVLLNSC